MEKCSYFIKDKALFGGFPTQNEVENLENHHEVKYFINLTCNDETKITPYITKYTYIHYPIQDRKIPENWHTFSIFIIKVATIIKNLKNNDRLYLSCRAGHGRSGTVVACLLCYIYNLKPPEALKLTNEYHNNRVEMKQKWRDIGAPQTRTQKTFVYKFFETLYFYRAYKIGKTVGFSNFSYHSIYIPNFGLFPTSEAALQAYKDPNNTEYVNKQLEAKTPAISKKLGRLCNLRPDWFEVRVNIMKNILILKIEQHPDFKENLLSTGLREIIESSRFDNFWGIGSENQGLNMLGKLLMEIRNEYYIKDIEI